MSKHDSQEEFLNNLYRQSAQETPPEELDERILELAKARHPHKRFAKTLQWQRLLSMAAVMLLSVYIFFDVSHDRPALMEDANMSLPGMFSEPSPQAPQVEPAPQSKARQLTAPMKEISQLKKQEAQQAAEPMQEMDMAESMSESAADTQPDALRSASPAVARESSVSDLENKAEQDQLHNEPDHLLQQISEYLKAGRNKEANTLFADFKVRFPDYPVPEAIRDAFAETGSEPAH